MLAYFFPPPLPTIPRTDDPAGVVHETWIRRAWQMSWRRRLVFAAMIALWPIYVAGAAVIDDALLGGRAKRETGKARWRQLAEQVRVAFVNGLAPRHYYMFELYRDGMAARAAEFLNRTETKAFLYGPLVDRSKWVDDHFPFANKRHFHRLCVMHGVPTVPVLAIANKGVLMTPSGDTVAALPPTDLFLKPRGLRGGLGAQVWCYRGGRYHRQGAQQDGWGGLELWLRRLVVQPKRSSIRLLARQMWSNLSSRLSGADGALDEAGLRRHLLEQSRQYAYLVQPRLRPHAALADLSLGALTTVRVLTCETTDGRVVPTHAVFRMPMAPDAVVDNFHAGGIAAPIDMKTGRLGKATDMGLRRDSAWHDRHPVSGAAIEGRVLPDWPAALDLCIRAQKAFSDRPFVGWDVALLDSGPCLVEGNGRPDIELIQRPYREPLGNSEFGQILAQWAARRFGLARRTASPDGGGGKRGEASASSSKNADTIAS